MLQCLNHKCLVSWNHVCKSFGRLSRVPKLWRAAVQQGCSFSVQYCWPLLFWYQVKLTQQSSGRLLKSCLKYLSGFGAADSKLQEVVCDIWLQSFQKEHLTGVSDSCSAQWWVATSSGELIVAAGSRILMRMCRSIAHKREEESAHKRTSSDGICNALLVQCSSKEHWAYV